MSEKKKLQNFEILLDDIPRQGIEVVFEDIADILEDTEECLPSGPIKAQANLIRSDGNIRLRGKIWGNIIIVCHRCLETFSKNIDKKFFYMLIPDDKIRLRAEINLKGEDMETLFYKGDTIRLGDIFREQILLQLPIQALCRTDCKGICAGCGASLNKEPCVCQEETYPSAFSVLKRLKKSNGI